MLQGVHGMGGGARSWTILAWSPRSQCRATFLPQFCSGDLFSRRRILLSVFNPKVWCGASRPEALQSKLKTAVHAPGKYRWEKNLVSISVHLLLRVLGTLANSVEFSEAWQCRFYFLLEICAIFNSARSGQGMVGSERCEVWWLCFLFSFQVWPIVQSFCDYQ